MMMAASFASPIIEKVNALPFVFHLWGGTGSGKSVALMAAMSVWGNPSMGKMVRTMNMTSNSMLSTAAFLKNIPFAGDELQTIKSKWDNYDKLIMCITEGVDRGRMSYDKKQRDKKHGKTHFYLQVKNHARKLHRAAVLLTGLLKSNVKTRLLKTVTQW